MITSAFDPIKIGESERERYTETERESAARRCRSPRSRLQVSTHDVEDVECCQRIFRARKAAAHLRLCPSAARCQISCRSAGRRACGRSGSRRARGRSPWENDTDNLVRVQLPLRSRRSRPCARICPRARTNFRALPRYTRARTTRYDRQTTHD